MQLYNEGMKKKNFDHLECPIARTLGVIGEWWDMLIIRDLFYRVNTFTELVEDLNIARNILTDRLKKLEREGVVQKVSSNRDGARHEYRLTEKGKDLYPILIMMAWWAEKWDAENGATILFDHGAEGHELSPRLICDGCGEDIRPRDIRLRPGPGVTNPKGLPKPIRPKGEGG